MSKETIIIIIGLVILLVIIIVIKKLIDRKNSVVIETTIDPNYHENKFKEGSIQSADKSIFNNNKANIPGGTNYKDR